MTTQTSPGTGNLPAEPNSFVGRERDLAELGRLLTDVRVLTLCGPGGIGKSRLAVRLAAGLAPGFADGAWLVELADLADPDLTARRVAAVLGVSHEPDRPLRDTLADALRPRRLLLVLDTCEHLVDACAALVQHLLASCRDVRVIATSREPLRVRGETVWRVPPLELPAGLDRVPAVPAADLLGSEAVRLFADRATAVRPGFALTEGNAGRVARLCRTLDGIPLAIELAAARLRALSVEQVADRLSDRFALLASGDRTAPARQQTLRAAVDWSYGLLTEAEQVLLRRLSVFSGWNLEMAEDVCADKQIPPEDVLDLVAALIDKSLVSLDAEMTGDARYRLLDTIGEYAADRLAASGEEAEIRAAHRDYLLQLAEDVVARAFVRGEPSWPERVALYRRIATEMANFRAALAECLSRADAEQGLRLCLALRSPWVAAGDLAEGIGWFDRFLGLTSPVPAGIRAQALVYRAELAYQAQDYAVAAQCARAALELFSGPEQPGESGALRVLALTGLQAGHLSEALASGDAAVAAARAAGDVWEEGLALATRAAVLGRLGRIDDARDTFDAALDTLRDNNGWGVAQTRYGYGTLSRLTGDHETALRHYRTALGLYTELDARPEMARCLAGIAQVALDQRDCDLARASLAEAVALSLAAGQRAGIIRGLEAFGDLALLRADPAGAARLAGAAGALRGPGGPGWRAGALLESARQQLGGPVTEALAAEGARLSAREAVALALQPDAAAPPPAGQPPPAAPPASAARPPALARSAAGAALTARELEIAALIARGLSNRGIAAELTISPATAARHVANIFGKLGFTSRAQVAAWVSGGGAGESGG
jgi:predicted ATPase/DNA-binding CsgD family transcriptional regulator